MVMCLLYYNVSGPMKRRNSSAELKDESVPLVVDKNYIIVDAHIMGSCQSLPLSWSR